MQSGIESQLRAETGKVKIGMGNFFYTLDCWRPKDFGVTFFVNCDEKIG